MAKYGWVVSTYPIGQLVASPILGWTGNKLGSIRAVCLATSVFFIAGNVLYSILTVFDESWRYALLILARFLIGCAAG